MSFVPGNCLSAHYLDIVAWEEVMLSDQQVKMVTEESVGQEIFVPHIQLENFPGYYNLEKFESLLHYAGE